MALSGTAIGTSIANIVAAVGAGTSPLSPSQLQTMWQNIMTAIYTDIKASAVVTVTSVTGVTTGPGVSGPGTGSVS